MEINKNEIKWDKKHHKPKKIKETICRNKSEKKKKEEYAERYENFSSQDSWCKTLPLWIDPDENSSIPKKIT